MKYKIAVISGDGIGPEIVAEAVKILNVVGSHTGHQFEFTPVLMGGRAIDETGLPLPDETVEICKASDAVLLGAVGGPKWDNLPGHLRPEAGLLGIRQALCLYANLRPAVLTPALADASPLKPSVIGARFDMLIVRELTGGIYFGKRGRGMGEGGEEAFDTERYTAAEIERIARVAFRAAQGRRRKITSVDKANVLESSRLWREVVHRVAAEYPDVECEDMLVDNAAMQLVRNPGRFDVMVTSNMFGDILSDEASMITGSIGMLPSASLGDGTMGLYEPIHGSAPDIAGRGIANPLATILSAAMLLRYSLGLEREALSLENAVSKTLDDGLRTPDIAGSAEDVKIVGTAEMGNAVAENLKAALAAQEG
jgi:3-isopropylmalate dehydrogenase